MREEYHDVWRKTGFRWRSTTVPRIGVSTWSYSVGQSLQVPHRAESVYDL